MSDLVTLRHPKLPASQTIQIDRRRIGAHLGAGWEEVKPEADTAASAETPEPGSNPETTEPPSESAPKRRSRKNTAEE